MARPKKDVKKERLEGKPSVSKSAPKGETVKIPPPNIQEPFSTEDIATASYLERQGAQIVGQTGNPPVFTFKPEDSEKIKQLLERR